MKSEANAATGDTPAWANKIVEDVNAALSTATANPQAGVPGTTPTAQVADTATGNSDTAKTAQLRLLAANVERTISQALSQASANS